MVEPPVLQRLSLGPPAQAMAVLPEHHLWLTRCATGIGHFIRRKPLGTLGGCVVLLMVLVALFAPFLAPYDPLFPFKGIHLEPPSLRFPFGLDLLGRDVFSRVIYGARVSVFIGFTATFLSVGAATVIGLLSGYYGGKLDLLVQRVVDILQAFPGLILALALVAIFSSSMSLLILALAVIPAPSLSRVIRGNTLSVKENTYVEAARVVGCGDLRILRLHVLPNIAAVIIVLASIEVGSIIIHEASLSFLGLGVQPPTPSWGQMISGAGRTYLLTHPWLAIFPGMALSLGVLGFNLFGDALRDVLDPRLRGQGK